MTELTATLFRKISIGSKRYVLGLHPRSTEPLISIRRLGRRTPYVVPASKLRIEGALAYGRAEQSAKREARKLGIPWARAKKKFLSTLLPPTIKQRKTKHAN